MKVLYLSHFKDGSGWANAAQDYILALDSVGVDVVPRAIKLNEVNGEVNERVQELEQKDAQGCNIVIQHILPHLMDYNGHFEKNIGLYVTETSHCRNTSWPERLNLMDELWVPNTSMLTSATNSFIENNIYVVPHAADMGKYQKEYELLQFPESDYKFIFYYIGENTRRKNLPTLVKAFHTAFSARDDVMLVLKAHTPGQSTQESERILRDLCNNVKDGLKLYPDRGDYHNEVLICQRLTDEQIMKLHATCNCFVSATLGEAWGIPIFDAMAMGNTPICTDTGGPRDFMVSGGWLVPSYEDPCFGATDTMQELYHGDEMWDAVRVNDLAGIMREVYEGNQNPQSENGVTQAYSYSHVIIGEYMKKILEGQITPSLCKPVGGLVTGNNNLDTLLFFTNEEEAEYGNSSAVCIT